jgi:hypothetical protein
MNRNGLVSVLAAVMVMSAAGVAAAQDSPDRVTVAFSDPSRPGTLEVHLVTGSISVKASADKQVVVEARSSSEEQREFDAQSATGLRRLPQRAGITVEEEANVVSVRSRGNQRVDLEIQVPVRTNLEVRTVNGGQIVIEGIEGDIEANNVNGSVTLTSVAGAVVAHTVNGKILVTMTRVTAEKPMAFTSLNGAVDVTLPPSVKANVKMRSDQGDVFTDFAVQTKPAPSATVEDTRKSGGRYRIDVDKSIYGTVNGGGPEFEFRTFNGHIYVRKGK